MRISFLAFLYYTNNILRHDFFVNSEVKFNINPKLILEKFFNSYLGKLTFYPICYFLTKFSLPSRSPIRKHIASKMLGKRKIKTKCIITTIQLNRPPLVVFEPCPKLF